MAVPVYVTEDAVVTTADGRVIGSIPVHINEAAAAVNASGQRVDPWLVDVLEESAIVDTDGGPVAAIPVRVVDGATSTNEVGQAVDAIQIRAETAPFYGADPRVTMVDLRAQRAWDGDNRQEVVITDQLTTVRATQGWATDFDGTEHTFAANEPRFTDQGLIIERAVTNLFPQPDAPITHTVAGLTAGHYLLWCRGAGSITVSGVFSIVEGLNPVIEGGYLRIGLATTQSITFTVAGSLTFAQVTKLPATTRPSILATAVHGSGDTNTRNVDAITITGALRTAMLRAPSTIVFEWFEPSLLWNINRRLFRGSGGSQTFTAVMTSEGKLNSSLATAAGTQFNITCNTIVSPTGMVRAYVAMENNNCALSTAGEVQNDTSATLLFDTITTLGLGSRNDTNAEDFNGFLSKIIVYPRRLTDAEMVTQSDVNLPFPDVVTYDAISTLGGAGGNTYTVTATGQVSGRLRLDQRRQVNVASSLEGVEPYADTLGIERGDLSFRGHGKYYLFSGGGMVIGGDTVIPRDILIEDAMWVAGNSDTGRQFEDRDCFSIWSGDTLVIRNCVFAYGIDEAASVYKTRFQDRVLRNILFEYCIFGPSLAAPVDGQGHPRKDEVPHNMGLLVADGVTNVVVRFCLFASCFQRSPTFGIVYGGFAYNNLIFDWQQYGMLVAEPVDQFEVRGITAAFVGNLGKPGPNTNATARAALQALLKVGDGSGIFFSQNALSDYTDFSADTVLDGITNTALIRGANRLSLGTSMPFVSPYTPMPTSTAVERQAVYNHVMDRVGVRLRDGSGNIITGDAGATTFTLAVLNAVRANTGMKINAESDFVGYPT